MTWFLKHGVPLLLVASSLAWTAHVVMFMTSASPRAKAACAGKTSFWASPNAYFWCLDRVEAGGKP